MKNVKLIVWIWHLPKLQSLKSEALDRGVKSPHRFVEFCWYLLFLSIVGHVVMLGHCWLLAHKKLMKYLFFGNSIVIWVICPPQAEQIQIVGGSEVEAETSCKKGSGFWMWTSWVLLPYHFSFFHAAWGASCWTRAQDVLRSGPYVLTMQYRNAYAAQFLPFFAVAVFWSSKACCRGSRGTWLGVAECCKGLENQHICSAKLEWQQNHNTESSSSWLRKQFLLRRKVQVRWHSFSRPLTILLNSLNMQMTPSSSLAPKRCFLASFISSSTSLHVLVPSLMAQKASCCVFMLLSPFHFLCMSMPTINAIVLFVYPFFNPLQTLLHLTPLFLHFPVLNTLVHTLLPLPPPSRMSISAFHKLPPLLRHLIPFSAIPWSPQKINSWTPCIFPACSSKPASRIRISSLFILLHKSPITSFAPNLSDRKLLLP